MLTRHAIDRICSRLSVRERDTVASVIQSLAAARPGMTAAIRLARLTEARGDQHESVHARESNGTDLWVVFKGGAAVTLFWRRPEQPVTRAILAGRDADGRQHPPLDALYAIDGARVVKLAERHHYV